MLQVFNFNHRQLCLFVRQFYGSDWCDLKCDSNSSCHNSMVFTAFLLRCAIFMPFRAVCILFMLYDLFFTPNDGYVELRILLQCNVNQWLFDRNYLLTLHLLPTVLHGCCIPSVQAPSIARRPPSHKIDNITHTKYRSTSYNCGSHHAKFASCCPWSFFNVNLCNKVGYALFTRWLSVHGCAVMKVSFVFANVSRYACKQRGFSRNAIFSSLEVKYLKGQGIVARLVRSCGAFENSILWGKICAFFSA